MEGKAQKIHNSYKDREQVMTALSEGIIGWFVNVAKIPLIWGGRIVIETGGVLVSATGGHQTKRPNVTPQGVAIRGALIGLFAYSSWQYSTVAIATLVSMGIATPGLAWLTAIAGMAASTMTQLFQARLLRGDNPRKRRLEYEQVALSRIDAEGRIDIAQAKADQYNRAGMLGHKVMGFFALAGWALEVFMMSKSPFLNWVTPWFSFSNCIPLVCALVLTIGFEVLSQLDEESIQAE